MLLSFVYLEADPRPRLFSHVYPPVSLLQPSNPPFGSRVHVRDLQTFQHSNGPFPHRRPKSFPLNSFADPTP